MAYVVTPRCIGCKYTDCAVVCPVQCFHEGKNMVTIDPDVCIDCGACEAECPVGAILSELDPESEKWMDFNREYSKKWPVLHHKKPALPEAEQWAKKTDKEKFFDPAPGEGS